MARESACNSTVESSPPLYATHSSALVRGTRLSTLESRAEGENCDMTGRSTCRSGFSPTALARLYVCVGLKPDLQELNESIPRCTRRSCAAVAAGWRLPVPA